MNGTVFTPVTFRLCLFDIKPKSLPLSDIRIYYKAHRVHIVGLKRVTLLEAHYVLQVLRSSYGACADRVPDETFRFIIHVYCCM
jgi:hypothetical protein